MSALSETDVIDISKETEHNNTQATTQSTITPPATERYKYLVFIGRFQPFHLGHKAVIDTALNRADKVIILIGSANLPRSLRNPFTVEERAEMITGAYPKHEASRIYCVGLDDALYNDTRWLQYVQKSVRSVTGDLQEDIALIGHSKDSSSYYLSLFPYWQSISVSNHDNLSSTPIRDSYLLGATPTPERIPDASRIVLDRFKKTEEYQYLQEEAWFIDDFKKQWQNTPYPPTFMTVDAVVVQSGHILLVERRNLPGRGLWSLPGGFLDQDETLFDACIRELREETNLQVSDLALRRSRHSQHTFDDPYRSARGRTITQAYFFHLKNDPRGLPEVKGGDDALKAFWLPLAELDPKKMFEDHYAIIIKMVGL
ncbi:bifunctional nicotinamide-nucleotide adenylyltransferase/Nudix hydroxylase [Psychrobacter lutiphocae]|uniref:bifunctional nicotinamide-nucleotide adenylyltransferase/Nudix hydroxylase n=1 Tax=Psychrobacter lutiphocae TaxID=540500 RepID=UPI00036E4475|nr:bifunctional nicotinamide-nucleotide adenylyltransferase/Nudix hydroxylase [Psychrobacter lutiphocae]